MKNIEKKQESDDNNKEFFITRMMSQTGCSKMYAESIWDNLSKDMQEVPEYASEIKALSYNRNLYDKTFHNKNCPKGE
jgi:predicted acetyltransferase